MKKFCLIFLLLVFCLLPYAVCADAEADINVMYRGEVINFDTEPYYFEDRIMVPVRGIFESLGASVSWNDETNTATAVMDDTTVCLTLGETCINVNGIGYEMDVPVQMHSDRIHAPARFVAESFGKKISYHNQSETAIISDSREYEFYPGLKMPVPLFNFADGAVFLSENTAFNGGRAYEYLSSENTLTDYLNFLQLDFGYEEYNMEYLESGVRYTYVFDNLKISLAEKYSEDEIRIELIPDVDKLYTLKEDIIQPPENEEIKEGSTDFAYDDVDYGKITGSELLDKYTEDDTWYYVYGYSFIEKSIYESHITSDGWTFYDFSMDIDTFSNIEYYKKGDAYLSVVVNHIYDLVVVAVINNY